MSDDERSHVVAHPLAEELKAHLLHWRGHWIKKLTPELRQALDQMNETDPKRAATLLLHGPAICAEGRERPFHRINEGWQFCATNSKCPCFMRHFHSTAEATNLAKRGVKNAAQCAEVKQKMRDTCQDRYGVDTTGELVSRRLKAEATNLERYGAKNVFASEQIKAEIREKVRLDHGVDHISQLPAHRERMRAGVRETFGVDNVGQHPAIRAKITATCRTRYGGVAPASSPQVREKMAASMEQRFGGLFQNLHILPEHRIIDKADFERRFAGRRWNVALDFSGGDRLAECEFSACLAREIMPPERNCNILEPLGWSGDRRTLLQIDNYFPTYRIGVEFCGGFFHSDYYGRPADYHAKKHDAAMRQGIFLFQVFEDEFIDHPEAVIATIKHRFGLTEIRTFARSLAVVTVSYHEACDFYNRFHVFGEVRATVHLGLRSDDHTLMACMSFIKRKPGLWELSRFATRGAVVGGASRLLRAFERTHDWQTIKSFVDLRWSTGGLYETLGFTFEEREAPQYSYVIGNRRFHKFNLRKSSKRFRKYLGTGMSERDMAIAENIPRVYDAGKWRVVKRR